MSEDAIPKPQPTDPPEVIAALETAAAHWAKGEQREGLKWLRRAAEAAEQADNDMRALEFARRAADITGLLGATSPPPLPLAPDQPTQEPPPVAVTQEPPPVAAKPALAPTVRASMPPAKPSHAPAAGAQAASRAQSAAAALAPTARGQVRVFVKTSSRDKGLYIVRPLESGKRPPLGTREAVLVFPED